MTRYWNIAEGPTSLRTETKDILPPSTSAIIPAGADIILPVIDLRGYKECVLFWTLGTPGQGRPLTGVITGWDVYLTALSDERVSAKDTAFGYLTPLARVDLWTKRPDIAFPSLPNDAAATDHIQFACAGFSFVVSVIQVSTDLELFTYGRSALGD